jgi:transketolase
MRNLFVSALTDLALQDERVLFLSGDLGFMALEPLRDKLGERFINVGVAEQNMVSVAAGLAAKGFQPWIYSIAPFVTLRPYEQLRNDVCMHNLPVRVVGNGGGYGYGIMGGTHHSLEDIGCMKLLPNMQVMVPTYADDVKAAVLAAHASSGPVYLRLAREIAGACPGAGDVWRTLSRGSRATVISTGPVVGGLLSQLKAFDDDTFEIVSVARHPFGDIPPEVVESVERTGALITLDEHLAPGGLGEAVSSALLGRLKKPIRFLPLSARGYPSSRYGSQTWHLQENGLAGESLVASLKSFLEGPHAG